MVDQYRLSAEYLDIMSRDAWQAIGPVLAEALRDVDASAGPVVDVGAGSGLGTEVVGRALPESEIVAIEPAAGLRAVLLAKLSDDPALAKRVTVLDGDVRQVSLPERLGAVVAMNMIGHLDPDSRQSFWALLAKRLAPGGPAVVNLQPPSAPMAIPESRFCEVVIGHRTYEGWGRAEPAGAEAVMWHMRYRTLEGGVVVAERVVDYRWWVLSEDQLRAELADHGLVSHVVGPAEMALYMITAAG